MGKQFRMNKPTIKIGVISDVVCPWCYIGKRRLEKAMENVSDKFHFEVEYFPFELNPQMPESGLNQKDYLTKKFGGEARYEQVTSHVTKVAEQEGLAFNLGRQKISPNTRKAHRIITLAREDGKQMAVVEAFFKAYFTDGADLSKNENLVQLAAEAGIDRARVESLLQGNDGNPEVEMAERELQKLGITGVPFFIIDNKYGLSGAQPSEVFMKAFYEAHPVQDAAEAGACDVDGKNC